MKRDVSEEAISNVNKAVSTATIIQRSLLRGIQQQPFPFSLSVAPLSLPFLLLPFSVSLSLRPLFTPLLPLPFAFFPPPTLTVSLPNNFPVLFFLPMVSDTFGKVEGGGVICLRIKELSHLRVVPETNYREKQHRLITSLLGISWILEYFVSQGK